MSIRQNILGLYRSYSHSILNLQISQVAGIVGNLIFTMVIVRIIDIRQYGEYILFISVLNFLSFLNLPGLAIVIRKGVIKKYDKIYYESIIICLKVAFTSSLIAIAIYYMSSYVDFSEFIPIIEIFNKELLSLNWEFVVIAILFLLPSSFAKYESFIVAKEKYEIIRNLKITDPIVKITFVCSAAYFSNNIFYIILAYLAYRIFMIIIGNIIVYKIWSKNNNALYEKNKLLKEGYKYNLIDIIGFTSRLDKIILGGIDPTLLALFHAGNNITDLFQTNMKSLFTPILIKWGRLNREKHLYKIKKYFFYIIFAGGVLAILNYFLSKIFIPILYGSDYRYSIYVAFFLSLTLILKPVGTFFSEFDTVQDKGNKYAIIMIMLPILHTVLMLILIPKFKIMGLVSTILIVHVFSSLILTLFVLTGRNYK